MLIIFLCLSVLVAKHINMEDGPLTEVEEQIGKIIVGAAFKIHTTLGPGLLEKNI